MPSTTNNTANNTALPQPIVVQVGDDDLDTALTREWLLTNRIGAYASSTVVGCNTRRYHGLLVAAAMPPVQRIVALSTVMEELDVGGVIYKLATNEFAESFSPRGVCHLREFVNDQAVRFHYSVGDAELIKEVILAEKTNAVAIRYTLRGGSGVLRLEPFTPLRDYHHLRTADAPLVFELEPNGVVVLNRKYPEHTVFMGAAEAEFVPSPDWWHKFHYRVDISRGQDGFEDLYTPGWFVYELADGQSCQFTACLDEPVQLDFATTLERRRSRAAELAAGVGPEADELTRRLAVASDAFVVERSFPNAQASLTILAGYHWFADWGRDAFISLPGLLLTTGRFRDAEKVFRTFADSISEGMLPCRFDDYSRSAHYNSIDASLWFIIAAERYLAAGGDDGFWRSVLMPAANSVLSGYQAGTRFDIRADADGLLTGGSRDTQLTWMDAKLGDEVITPRHGKAVEINAMWHSAHRIMAERCRKHDRKLADTYASRAEIIASAFAGQFWNSQAGCLYDCIGEHVLDDTIRPNQIFAVSLPHCPLTHEQQASIVHVVGTHLLTTMGLRSLSPEDPRYRSKCGGSWESRDRAYHQGTVWAYLMGPFIEAYLKVEGDKLLTLAQANDYIQALEPHLHEAAIGFVNEIFDGDAPHAPRGCVAQAWSVAELLRAKQLLAEYSRKLAAEI